MLQPLAKITGYIFTFLFSAVVIIFGATFLIVNTQNPAQGAVPQKVAPPAPPVILTKTAEKGKALFKSNCASCHKLYKKAVGPALHNVENKYEKEWLYAWINNSATLIASGDARAVAVYEEYGQSNMNAFPQLSTEDIDNILEYTSVPKP